jgi:hypothetical protein
MAGAPEIPIPQKHGIYTPPPKIDFDPLFNPFDSIPISHTAPHKEPQTSVRVPSTVPFKEPDNAVEGYGEIFEKRIAEHRNILQIQGKYLLTTVES